MRRTSVSVVTAACALFAAGFCRAELPNIESLSSTTLPRSGRVVISGSAFGQKPGAGGVLIDGAPAIVTRWAADEIHAYVPEKASLGPVAVEVVSVEGSSLPVTAEVTTRVPARRVRWYFEMDRWTTRQFVEVAPDGTIYTSDALGLYALSPDGALLWFVAGVGDGRPISLAADGTIYAAALTGEGRNGNVVALHPDGTVRWEFDAPTTYLDLVTGPNVGPDGNIYAYQDLDVDDGLGFFSLTPEGSLRWSDRGDPVLNPLSVPSNSEIVFSADRLYSGIINIGSGTQPVTYAFDLTGNQLWFTGNSDLDAKFQSFPVVDPRGRAIGVWGQTGLIALDPSGSTEWITVHPSQINVEALPAVDSAGNLYAGVARGEMWSLAEDGSIRWVLPNRGTANLSKVGVSPDDTILVAHLARPGRPTWITGHDPATGGGRWGVELPNLGGLVQQVTSLYPVFSNDAVTAYVTTSSADYSRIYAIRVDGP